MALIVHGFPSDIAALRFEWAWQNPNRSRRLKHVTGKCRKESAFQFRVRVMCSMLSQTPWKRLPLTIRWLKQDYAMDLNPIPPMHMPIAYGPVTAKKKKHKSNEKHNFESKSNMSKTVNDKDMTATEHSDDSDAECIPLIERLMKKSGKISHEKDKLLVCSICENMVASDICVSCLNDSCEMLCHLQCLAKHCLANQNFMLVPVDTVCPLCKHQFLWGDLIRKTQGFHQYLNNENV
ncbi:unnamed protein product [Clavelina lepadiformis]|uniref:Structure-specific endonuclease subunit SLX1 C-terminal domain-containing protein n=1 Tax=Clavelina lepadiformis TaxID=159417 RepID=A0ABP0GRZ6_CLALP